MSRGSAAVIAAIAAACAAPLALSDFHVFQLTLVLVYAIALLGLNILTGYNGQISLGHGAFYGIGAYTTGILIEHAWLPYWAAVPASGVVCLLLGFAFGLPALRLEGPYLALATFALALATPQILKHDALAPWTHGSEGILLDEIESPIGALGNADWRYFFTMFFAVLLYVAAWNLVRGRTGRALIAIRDHPIAAASMGIDTALYKSLAFGTSAMYTGVAGALGTLLAGIVSPESFTILLSIDLLVGVVVGGVASIAGNFFGAAFIVFIPNLASDLSVAAPWAIYGILLILFITLMPRGIVGLIRTVRARLTGGGR